MTKQRDGLASNPDNFLLVNANGTVFGCSQADRVMKRLISFIGCDKQKMNLTLYSIRVGVTSLAHHQGIDALKVMRFVLGVQSKIGSNNARVLYPILDQRARDCPV